MQHEESKKAMLAVFQYMREELDALLEGLTMQERNRQGTLERWSAKDMLAHLVFWYRHLNQQIEKNLAGEKALVSGDYLDQINDGVFYQHLQQSFEEARQEEADAYRKFLKIIIPINADDVCTPGKFTSLGERSLLERALGSHGWHVAAHISDFYQKNGQPEKARALQKDLCERLGQFSCWKANAFYNLACFYALNGLKDEALSRLREAFQEKPELIDWAKQDSDLNGLRNEAEYRALIGE